MTNLALLVDTLVEAARSNDPTKLKKAQKALILALPKEAGAIEASLARKVMKALRSSRRFNCMRPMAQAILDDGCNDPAISIYYAQSLIEAGELVPARAVLNEQLTLKIIDTDLKADAYGILGRSWKDLAVRARPTRQNVAQIASRNAFEAYRAPYEQDPSKTYQGVNLVAVAGWDQGLALSAEEREWARQVARDIVSHIEETPEENRELWDSATAGEALVGLGDLKRATSWFSEYLQSDDLDSFALAGTVRQLTELWELDASKEGAALLAPMRARLLDLPGGSFTLNREQMIEMEQIDAVSFEKVLGDTAPVTFTWWQTALETAKSVVLVRKNGRGIGTGFLVRAKDVHPNWGDECLVLTNSHVVSAAGVIDAATPDEVSISFEVSKDRKRYEVEEVVWESSPSEHDAALLRLREFPVEAAAPLRLSNSLPLLDDEEPARVYIIGHPDGAELSFSFEDNRLLDYEISIVDNDEDLSPCRIHYRTPTSPGSSGSPVFSKNWKILGVHHSGSKDMPRLNGKVGFYPANEGIWVQSIRRALAKEK